jgi:hypothetical protein
MAHNSLAAKARRNGYCVPSRLVHLLVVAILLSTVSGCMRWHPGLTVEGYGKPAGDVLPLLEKASRLEAIVDTRGGLFEMV